MSQEDARKGQPQNREEADLNEDNMTMEQLLAQGDLTLDQPKSGEIRKGMIASTANDEILVSIGAKSEGVIPSRELSQLSAEERAKLQVGTEILVYVVSPESRQGTLMLSFTRAMEEDDWLQAEELMKKKTTIESTIEGFNKGGLIVNVQRLRGFVPASQIGNARRMSYQGDTPEQRWSKMVGEPIVVRIIEVDRERRRLIISEKAASSESREALKERLLDELEIGEVRTGRVTSLATFGAFVNINGADGLVHLSEISWEHINHPSETLEVGQEVKVKIISLDKERKRIGLSLRQLENDPWDRHVEAYQVGQLIEGTITRLTKFGAFARIDENLEGLIHVSELADRRVEHPKEVVHEGDVITLRIIKIDTENRRIGLSLRKVESLEYSDTDWAMVLAEMDSEGDDSEADDAPAADSAAESEMATDMQAAIKDAVDEGMPPAAAEERLVEAEPEAGESDEKPAE
ncbi:MAG: S1 RNA-binding domain-containing protein [Anaerolineae bacterium]|nr:MAG: S1 RNA-binding domain-containing protein [Anaerolineae bacterium]